MTTPAELVALVLDDDELWLRSLARLLSTHGIRSLRCTTAEQAFAALEEQPVDLCVIDFVLGGGWDGARFARALREKLGEDTPPLVLLSGTLDEVDFEDRRPFDASYAKDLPPEALVAELRAAATEENGRPRSHSRIRPVHAGRKRRQTPS